MTPSSPPSRRALVLGIETSCDETAAAIVERGADGSGRILSEIVLSQLEEHAAFGGVVPEIAARAHVEALDGIVRAALREAGIGLAGVDAIAATAGPGLIGGVIVGLTTAKALAYAAGKPLIAVNHLEGHALTARLTDGLDFPYLLLLVSGGHSQFVAVEGVGRYRRLGSTIDDALGEAFDKAAKLLGLAYPGGPAIERMAALGDAIRFDLPRPLKGKPGADFSFSGLKTALRLAAEAAAPLSDTDVADLAAAFQAAVVDVVADRAAHAMAMFAAMTPDPSDAASSLASPLPGGERDRVRGIALPGSRTDVAPSDERAPPHPLAALATSPHRGEVGRPSWQSGSHGSPPALVVAGGVAANQAIRAALDGAARAAGFRLVAPPMRLCTDNGVMIAWAGAERLALGLTDGFDAPARPRWPLDALSAPVLGGGHKGAKA